MVMDTLPKLSTRNSYIDGILENDFGYDSCFGNIGIEHNFLLVIFWAMSIDTVY